jgi:hypothetical protein
MLPPRRPASFDAGRLSTPSLPKGYALLTRQVSARQRLAAQPPWSRVSKVIKKPFR